MAAIARPYLKPQVLKTVDALLAADTDMLEAHDMMSAATWADTFRNSHRETAQWHFVDIELSKPDLKVSLLRLLPRPPSRPAPDLAQDCIIDRTNRIHRRTIRSVDIEG